MTIRIPTIGGNHRRSHTPPYCPRWLNLKDKDTTLYRRHLKTYYKICPLIHWILFSQSHFQKIQNINLAITGTPSCCSPPSFLWLGAQSPVQYLAATLSHSITVGPVSLTGLLHGKATSPWPAGLCADRPRLVGSPAAAAASSRTGRPCGTPPVPGASHLLSCSLCSFPHQESKQRTQRHTPQSKKHI